MDATVAWLEGGGEKEREKVCEREVERSGWRELNIKVESNVFQSLNFTAE